MVLVGTLPLRVPIGGAILAEAMPIYEYRCEKGHTFEVMQRFSDDPIAVCETCEAPVQKVLTAPAVHFKGKGFYSTDYGSRKRSRELKDAADGKSDSSSKSAESSSSDSSSSDSSSSSDAATTSKAA
jgi:putative FmdB family regulatory protein